MQVSNPKRAPSPPPPAPAAAPPPAHTPTPAPSDDGAAACEPDDHRHAPASRPGRLAADPIALDRAAAIFRAAGEPGRLRVLELLARGPRCVTEVADALGVDMATLSQRLRVLKAAGLVKGERRGRHILYSLLDRHVEVLLRSALEHAGEHARGLDHHEHEGDRP